ncbi:DUF4395 domain-containing protein [Bacillus weihaiensis]|uniref:DUF4395 domain-containing protein n=1 Tax=Bacillus weihaiensis TaxID=1547283 RepID=A0A1L3MR41_9BACI|nr:DUF4395 domain-containing protein [Bacillus weihaiensis]APH04772.1 hypothetical protein A9C19_08445 [Bacillus weihaiensis]
MKEDVKYIPRPLVRSYQWSIVASVIIVWFTGAYALLLVPLLAGISGLLFKRNFIMEIAKVFLRKELSEYIPEDVDQQRFNSVISIICLVGGLLGYIFGIPFMAYFFTAMVAIAAFVAILGFCIGCFIRFQWKQYQYKRVNN